MIDAAAKNATAAVRIRQAAIGSPGTTRLETAMEEVLDALLAGGHFDRDALLARYPDVAVELRDCLESLDFIHNVAPQLRETSCRGRESFATGDSVFEGQQPVAKDSRPLQPATLGDFRILREIGRGGMGVVYEAEQMSLGRRVALKVLPFAAMLDKQQLRRFKNEARAAATLDHPNIVAVHSVGEERGVHYYAMQLVEGQSLAQVIDQLRAEDNERKLAAPFSRDAEVRRSGARDEEEIRNDGAEATAPLKSALRTPHSAFDTQPVAAFSTLHVPRSSFPAYSTREYFRTVARLGVQAAEALDHAHQNGVLHRDVKPANLLVDDDGKLWVTDFGLARLETDAGMTMTGDLIGTLRYMSPEQALAKRGVVDHRSDVYSLGATLHELLTLRPPFDGDDRRELLRQIAFDEPQNPRQANSRIPRDLETIVLKAIEKNAADRYATAQELADDLRRYWEHRMILARRPSYVQRAAKWARRNVALISFGAAAFAISTLSLLIAALLTFLAYNGETRQRAAAVANLRVASDSIDRMLTRVADDRYFHGDLEHAETVAADATEFYEKLLAHSDDPELRYRAAESYSDVVTIWNLVGRHEEAGAASRRVIELVRPLIAAFPMRPDYLEARAYGYLTLGQAEWALRRFRDSEEPTQQAAADFQRLLRQSPHNADYQLGLAKALGNLGLVAWALDHLDAAEEYYSQVDDIERHLPEEVANSAAGMTDRAATFCNWAIVAREKGDSQRAMELLEKAVDLQKQSLEEWPTNPVAVDFLYLHYVNIAETCVGAGRHAAAAKAIETMIWAFPDRLRACHDGATMLLRCAKLADSAPNSHMDNAQMQDGAAYRQRARELVAKASGARDRTPEAVINFAWFLMTCDDASFRDPSRALDLVNSVLDQASERHDARFALALAHYRNGAWQAAEDAIQASNKLIAGGRDRAYAWLLTAMIRAHQGRIEEAQRLERKAAEWVATSDPSDPALLDLATEAKELVERASQAEAPAARAAP